MSVLAEEAVETALYYAKARRLDLGQAVTAERTATVTYIDAALAAGWTWERIGERLGITGTGARRFYYRNRRRVQRRVQRA